MSGGRRDHGPAASGPGSDSGGRPRTPAPVPVDLSVTIGGLRFRNPVLAASGCFGYGADMEPLLPASAFGGIVTKTILEAPRAGNPPPRIVETPGGLINSIGLEGVGIERFIEEKIPRFHAVDTRLVVSIGGHDVGEYARLAARLDRVARVDALELNISCPNVAGGTDFSTDPGLAAETVSAVKKATGKPVWAKLTPNVTRIGLIGQACEKAGADALSAVNTFTGLAVDVATGEAVLPRGIGGLSGPAIRPLALAKVWELSRSVSIPIVGIGGIATAKDALEFFIAGASAVQLGTVLFIDPQAPDRVIDGVESFLRHRGLASVGELVGTLKIRGAGA